jgi:hypothetical protein
MPLIRPGAAPTAESAPSIRNYNNFIKQRRKLISSVPSAIVPPSAKPQLWSNVKLPLKGVINVDVAGTTVGAAPTILKACGAPVVIANAN